MTSWNIRALEERDKEQWAALFEQYCTFYHRELTPEHLECVWSWFMDGRLSGLVAERSDAPGALRGMAHLRPVVRPTLGVVAGYLDDLFIDPEARGSGVVDALFESIRTYARTQEWDHVRWITAEDNYRARAVYDRLATRTPFLTYNMVIEP
ncbi:GNAT family N-acetyltransferase [Arthrobacter sp. NPDC090010]|uniref:GNAT family N-acetyltransferase n=1 Tax=Arthrobacter sp. NPDC090010 TaxID=3363942 RepID=UPI00381F63E7